MNKPPFFKGAFKKAGSDAMKKYNPILKKPARALRKSMTDAERTIWAKVRGKQIHGLQFYRQKPLLSFIVDFYCPKAKLVIELDGGQHFTEDQRKKDRDRDFQMAAVGLRVLRFNNRQVLKQTDAVMALIWHEVGAALKIPPDPPLPKGGK